MLKHLVVKLEVVLPFYPLMDDMDTESNLVFLDVSTTVSSILVLEETKYEKIRYQTITIRSLRS